MTRDSSQKQSKDGRPLRLAYFSPLPPAKTGIADYSFELLPWLANTAKITVFVDGTAEVAAEVTAELKGKVDFLPITAFPDRRWFYDLPLYQMGNSGPNHEAIYRTALKYPGIVVIHENILHHFIAYATIGQRNHAAYAREIGYALGSQGYDLAWAIRLGLAEKPEYELALNNRLIDRCLGIIVHSNNIAEKIRQQRTDRPVQVVPQHRPIIEGSSLRGELGLTPNTVIFASTGLVNSTKCLDMALEAFARLRRVNPNVFYLIAGGVHNDVDLKQLIRKNHLQGAVRHTGFVDSLQEFTDWTFTADILVNLRNPTLGETSATALRGMAAGKPLIVFDHGWYSEIPDEICLKVDPANSEALFQAMRELAVNNAKRVAMGHAAQDHIVANHQPDLTAEGYVSFARAILSDLGRTFS